MEDGNSTVGNSEVLSGAMSGMATAQRQSPAVEIDERGIMAIINAVAKRRSFVVWYGDIYDELRNIVEDDDEFHEIENKLYEDIVERRIKNVYRFWGTCDSSECDIVVVSPVELDERQLKILEELVRLYSFKRYDGDEDERGELTLTIHNLIKMWSSSCLKSSSPAEAVYNLAKAYGLEIEEEEHLDRWYAGNIYYTVEGLDKRIVKSLWYCNDCVNFDTGNNFIEKCKTWHFEGEEEP